MVCNNFLKRQANYNSALPILVLVVTSGMESEPEFGTLWDFEVADKALILEQRDFLHKQKLSKRSYLSSSTELLITGGEASLRSCFINERMPLVLAGLSFTRRSS